MAGKRDGQGTHFSLDSTDGAPRARDRVARSRGESHLAADDIEELRAAIERSLCEGEMSASGEIAIDDELRKSIRIACAKARLQGVRAEHVLIDVKQIWMSIPSMLSTRTAERLSEIVSTCIEEYYGDRDQLPS
ncbi:MAG: hypothetical protein H0U66_06875 [Gemmatimonadaceae bacterium]|nr:hypothetical protein [Gemmatimonadaceae bacterium]